MSEKAVKNIVEICLFGLVIVMLSYAWTVHFYYGVILNRTGESVQHAGFWSVLYPISIFLLSSFFGKRLRFNKSTAYIGLFLLLIIIGLLLCVGGWDWFYPYFYAHRNIFWTSWTVILISLVCIRLLIQLRKWDKKKTFTL